MIAIVNVTVCVHVILKPSVGPGLKLHQFEQLCSFRDNVNCKGGGACDGRGNM